MTTPRKKYQRQPADGNSIYLWLTSNDMRRIERIREKHGETSLVPLSRAVVIRSALVVLERHASEIAAVVGSVS
jgi:hypothetical protein